ncbi:hypothetical protein J3Q64DRAFT_1016194 [Phycomyces blakesleeanus]|uniref:Uncharacterized protein n=1 Tax=Phycomyces blakesleeanus TaxID=4837 RepID=A0ABR3BBU2_PHYBL
MHTNGISKEFDKQKKTASVFMFLSLLSPHSHFIFYKFTCFLRFSHFFLPLFLFTFYTLPFFFLSLFLFTFYIVSLISWSHK